MSTLIGTHRTVHQTFNRRTIAWEMLCPPTLSVQLSADEASPLLSRESSISATCHSSSYACLSDLNASPPSLRCGKDAPHLVVKLVRLSPFHSGRTVLPRAPRLSPLLSDDDSLEMELLILDSPALALSPDVAPQSRLAERPPRLSKLSPISCAPEIEMEPLMLPAALPAALSMHCLLSDEGPRSQLSLYREMHTAAFSALRDARIGGACCPPTLTGTAAGGHGRGRDA
jgi:hypothetical protein